MAAIGSSTQGSPVQLQDFTFGAGSGIYTLPIEMIKLVGKVFVDAVSAVTLALTCSEIKHLIPITLPKSKFCKKAAKLGHVRIIQWGVDQNCRWTPAASGAAAKAGQISVLNWAWNRGCLDFEKTTIKAAKNNQGSVLDWLFEKGAVLNDTIADAAGSKGHIELYQGLKLRLRALAEDEFDGITIHSVVIHGLIEAENFPALRTLLAGVDLEDLDEPSDYLDIAAGTGNLEIFKFLVELGIEVDNNTIQSAASWGRINILEYICYDLKKRRLFDKEISITAAVEEHWHLVHWLISQKIRCSSLVPLIAIEKNHVDMLESFEKAGWLITKEASQKAAEVGRWDVVEKLMDKGIFCESFLYYFYAAKQNRIDLLERLKETNAPRFIENSDETKHLLPWTGGDADLLSKYGIAMAAAFGGNAETLQWVKDNGFEWQHECVLVAAAVGGNLDTFAFLLQIGCPCAFEQLYIGARVSGNIDIIERLSEFPFETKDARVGAFVAKAGRGDLLKSLVEKGCPVNKETISSAASEGHWDIVNWLMAIGCEWNQRVIVAAAGQGQVEFLAAHIFEEIKLSLLQADDHSEYMDFMEKLRLLAEYGHWEIFKAVVTHYVNQGDPIIVLDWVKEQGYGFDVEAVTTAARSLRDTGNHDVMNWLQENNYLDAEELSFDYEEGSPD